MGKCEKDDVVAADSTRRSSYFPKLPIFSLLLKSPEDSGSSSPPLSIQASVPFRWEEAPGKPKPFDTPLLPEARAASYLKLPPRMLADNHDQAKEMISPLNEVVRKQLRGARLDTLGAKAGHETYAVSCDKMKKAAIKIKRRLRFIRFFRPKSRLQDSIYQSIKRMGSGCLHNPTDSSEDIEEQGFRRLGFPVPNYDEKSKRMSMTF